MEQHVAWLSGYRRVLWQASPDHRGVPDAPGRVATLAREPSARCGGMAFRLPARQRDDILSALDEREQGGYDREIVTVALADGRRVGALTYIGWPDNPWYLGPAPPAQLRAHIAASHGPSGANTDYVVSLARELERLGIADDELSALAATLAAT